jgi:hypothetical protein
LKPERLKNAVDLLVRRRRETDEWNYRENNYSNSDSSSGKEVKHCSCDWSVKIIPTLLTVCNSMIQVWAHLVKNTCSFCGAQRFITVFTASHYLSKIHLIISYCLCLVSHFVVLLEVFQPEFLISHICAEVPHNLSSVQASNKWKWVEQQISIYYVIHAPLCFWLSLYPSLKQIVDLLVLTFFYSSPISYHFHNSYWVFWAFVLPVHFMFCSMGIGVRL